MTDPVDGALVVRACAQPDSSPESLSYSALVTGVVSAPGMSPRRVEFHTTVPAKRCPVSNQRIPVVVDRANANRIAVKWDQVPVRNRLDPFRTR